MQRLKRVFLYIVIVLVMAVAVCTVFRGLVYDCVSSAFGGAARTEYFRASVSSDGKIYAVGLRGGQTRLTVGTPDGKREYTMAMPELPSGSEYIVGEVFACPGGGIVFSARTSGADGGVNSLLVCRAGEKDGKAEILIEKECTDKKAVLSAFAEYDGEIRFAIWQDGVCETYGYEPGVDNALRAVDVFKLEEPFVSAVPLADGGTLFCTGGGRLVFSDGREYSTVSETAAIRMWQADEGVFFLDGASGTVKRLNTADMSVVNVFSIESAELVDMNFARGGTAAMITDGGALMYFDGASASDVSGALYGGAGVSILLLVVLAVAVLFASYALWYLLCEVRKLKISLVIRKGALLLVVIGLGLAAVLQYAAEPYIADRAEEQAKAAVSTAAALLKESGDTQSADLESMAGNLAGAGYAYGDAELCVFTQKGERYVTKASSEMLGSGVDAYSLLYGSEFVQAIGEAFDGGEAWAACRHGGADSYTYALKLDGERVLTITMDGRALAAKTAEEFSALSLISFGAGLVLLVILILILLQTRLAIRRVTRGMDAVSSGSSNVEIVERSGDELEGLADSFNTLARNISASVSNDSRRNEAYLRFVPQQIITLLGAGTVENVNKQSFSSKYMATMDVHFLFDEKVYESRSRELFDNINEVIERTAGIIPQNGGTVYDFSHDGYSALFDADGDACVSAAVAIRQEVIALNRDRSKKGQSMVKLHIALDVGDVMMGIVGDETRMEATAISASFNTTRMLTTLFSRFEANILCTEEVMNRAESYGGRYIGKTRDGREMIRVYEIFDGDAYSTRAGKASSTKEFSEGVYTLYSRDFSAAKRIFMDIARKNSADGVAKFYLYLADRFEKEAPEDISLDY